MGSLNQPVTDKPWYRWQIHG